MLGFKCVIDCVLVPLQERIKNFWKGVHMYEGVRFVLLILYHSFLNIP